jgi:5'-nucleotidase
VATRVTISHNSQKDPEVAEAVDKFHSIVLANMENAIGRTIVPLDTNFSEIRTKETNISNLCTSIMAQASNIVHCHCHFEYWVHSCRQGYPKLRTGEKLLQILENGVSQYPAMEGQFLFIDGTHFAFHPSKPSGSQIVGRWACVRSSSSCSNPPSLILLHQHNQRQQNRIPKMKERLLLLSLPPWI